MKRKFLGGSAFGAAGLAAAASRMAPQLISRMSDDFKREILPAPHHPRPAEWPQTGLHATWLGHSTVLLSIDGFLILTDPVFSDRVGLQVGPLTLGIKRLIAPAGKIKELPRPDLILLSHAHMDHFDLPSLRQLESTDLTGHNASAGHRSHATHVITAARTSDLLRADRYHQVTELKWGEQTQAGPALVRAFPVNHWGARMRNDTYRGYNGYVIEVGRYRVIFGGDTAFTDSFKQLRTSRPVDLAIMPIGAYNPWIRAHCNPEQALQMAEHAGADRILPVHHRTFQLSYEPATEPLERLLIAAGRATDRVPIREIGGEFHEA